MNKDKLKLRLLLTSCCFIITFFVACQFDDSVETKQKLETTNQHFKLERIKLDKFSKNSKLINQLSKIASNKNSNKLGKTVLASDGSFTINTEFATYIESDNGKHSYTFKINRNNPEYLLENLVLSSNDSLGYVAYIAQYDINEHEYQMLIDNSSFNVSEKIILSKLNDNKIISTIFSKESIEIQTMCLNSVTQCEFGLHWGFNGGSGNLGECDVPHTFTTFYNWVECTETIEIVGGGGPGGDGSSGGGSGDSTDSTYDGSDTSIHGNGGVSTAPTLEEDEEMVEDPCEGLSKLLEGPDMIQAIINLEGYTDNDKEYGYAIKTFENSTSLAPPSVIQSSDKNPNIIDMEPYTGGNYIGAYHTHPNPTTSGIVPMFSPGDLKWLLRVARAHNIPHNEKDYSLYFLTLTVDSGTYAIKIQDMTTFSNFIGNKYNDFKRKIENIYHETNAHQSTASDLQKNFLKSLEEYRTGIGLYKLNNDKTNWEELNLNPTQPSADPIKTPCN